MEARAIWKYARITPRKARMLADQLRGKDLAQAEEVMQMVPRKSSAMWQKVIDSAVANLAVVKGEGDLDPDVVYIKEIKADKGPVWKRWLPRAMGRATRIDKHTSHLTVIVAER